MGFALDLASWFDSSLYCVTSVSKSSLLEHNCFSSKLSLNSHFILYTLQSKIPRCESRALLFNPLESQPQSTLIALSFFFQKSYLKLKLLIKKKTAPQVWWS